MRRLGFLQPRRGLGHGGNGGGVTALLDRGNVTAGTLEVLRSSQNQLHIRTGGCCGLRLAVDGIRQQEWRRGEHEH